MNASFRETSQDVVAREKGDAKESERRMSFNKMTKDEKATNLGSDTEVPSRKPASVRKDSSDSTKARTSSLKREKTNENQYALPKSTGSPALRAKGHNGSTISADPSPNDDQKGKKRGNDFQSRFGHLRLKSRPHKERSPSTNGATRKAPIK